MEPNADNYRQYTCTICGVTFTDNDMAACSWHGALPRPGCFYGKRRAGQPPVEDAFEVPEASIVRMEKGRAGDSIPELTTTDAVIRPNHYARFAIEPIEFIMVNDLPFWVGNVVKYTLRYDAKNGIEDLKKAKRYLEMQIKKMEGDAQWAK